MYLTVYNEFANKDLLTKIEQDLGLRVDVAEKPNALATSDAEKDIVATTAKLMIQTPYAEVKGLTKPSVEDAASVDALLQKLAGFGFSVTHRNPVTSAGCPMVDRVLLKYSATA
eukprot:GILI01030929.1.p1 GENE.GILI01030929.1~~GILI01030929.1.p1  ORF type:complete len:114 (-),score=23.84 GILI01030929.1:80-421(-)